LPLTIIQAGLIIISFIQLLLLRFSLEGDSDIHENILSHTLFIALIAFFATSFLWIWFAIGTWRAARRHIVHTRRQFWLLAAHLAKVPTQGHSGSNIANIVMYTTPLKNRWPYSRG